LNIFHLLTKYSAQRLETMNFFIDVLLPVTTKFQRGILFSCRIIGENLLRGGFDNMQRKVNDQIKLLIEEDLKRSMDRNVEDI